VWEADPLGAGRVGVALRTKAPEMSDRLTNRLGEFALVPRWLASAATGTTLRLWCVLWVYSGNGTHAAWPSHETLADDLEVSVSTVKRCLRELTDLGVLSCEPRSGTSSLYILGWRIGTPRVTSELHSQVTDDLPPRSPMTYKERLSEIENPEHVDSVTHEPQQQNKLTRAQVRDIVTKSAFCPTCREKLSRCLCDSDGSETGSAEIA
jgi:uncharacterized protein YwbE